MRFLDHTQRRTTIDRTPLDEWSSRRRDLYLTTHNTHNRQTSMPPVGFEPTTSAGERPKTHALDRAATGTGSKQATWYTIWRLSVQCFSCSCCVVSGLKCEHRVNLSSVGSALRTERCKEELIRSFAIAVNSTFTTACLTFLLTSLCIWICIKAKRLEV